MIDNQIIIDKVNVSGCEYLYTDSKYNDKCCSASIGGDCLCKPSEMLCVKYVEHLKEQLKRKEQECERLKWYLKEIRDDELKNLDIECDEYETHCIDTDYSNIINLVEEALEERSPEDCRYRK